VGSAGFALSKKEGNPVLGFGDFPLSSFPPPAGGYEVLTLFQESAELAAGGFKRPLLLLGVVVIQNRASVLDHLKNQSLDGYLSQGWGFMQIADHLSAQNPEVVNVFPDGFLGQSEVDQMFQEGPEVGHHFLSRNQVFGQSHPASGPFGKVFTVVVEAGRGGLL